ncbi:hypothetical protein OE09_1991 [Flavobacteriaceae bacterium MAR_2010_72]|nr:hypothetical protein OE09_1991 [Flavobacteriaceae bacterium MAR_2010_72]TVZ59298.1 hypothetical protein NA63_1826 [Flavobacteriaceae bacterium MAR_2010_105]
MKKLILLTCFLVLTAFANAQDKDRGERIKALKVAFITERLELSESEAQKFWPIYNTFEESYHKLRKQSYEKRKKENLESLSEEEAKTLLTEMSVIENQKHKLREQFTKDLLKAIPAKKIILLKATEDAFNKRMFEEYKKRRQKKEERP